MADMQMLEISQDILDSSRLSLKELKVELAVTLYAQGKLSAGKARELAEMALWEFRQVLASRRIPAHYDITELNEDLSSLHDLDRQ
jgi:predicted HTH domain antitoxin